MTVEELIEVLSALPPTAFIVVRIHTNISVDGQLAPLVEPREARPLDAHYSHGEAFIELDEGH